MTHALDFLSLFATYLIVREMGAGSIWPETKKPRARKRRG